MSYPLKFLHNESHKTHHPGYFILSKYSDYKTWNWYFDYKIQISVFWRTYKCVTSIKLYTDNMIR